MAVLTTAAGCGGGQPESAAPQEVRISDPARDTSSAPAGDLRGFRLRSAEDGVRAQWTTTADPTPGTRLDLLMHGPATRDRSGKLVVHPYGLTVRVRAGHSGRTVSAFVPRARLDRPGSPPFPYLRFRFQARVRGESGGVDFAPGDRLGEELAYVSGRLCPNPCNKVDEAP